MGSADEGPHATVRRQALGGGAPRGRGRRLTASIDSGTFAYCDAQSPAKYAASKPALAKLLRAMETPVPGYPHRASAGTVVGLFPGMGDGHYFSYWALDDAGAAFGLLTDFAILDGATGLARASRS